MKPRSIDTQNSSKLHRKLRHPVSPKVTPPKTSSSRADLNSSPTRPLTHNTVQSNARGRCRQIDMFAYISHGAGYDAGHLGSACIPQHVPLCVHLSECLPRALHMITQLVRMLLWQLSMHVPPWTSSEKPCPSCSASNRSGQRSA
jgi:hypothetical protein